MGSLAALSAAIEARDPYSRGHSSRVTVFAQAMARRIGLETERVSVLRLGALLHDIGKLAVPSTVLLKLHAGLTRPAIATLFPTARQPIVVLDSGANVDCSAQELVQFARLGAVYAEDVLGRHNPIVGLLSIGEEAEKGNAVVKEANQLLRSAGVNFQGNIEGRDLPAGGSDRGPIDVVVCDGFVGNVLLKFYEAIAPMMIGLMSTHAGIEKAVLMKALKHLDYSEYGGAPLLGVRGVSVISHGKSSPRAIKNAIKVAAKTVESRMSEHIGRRLSETNGNQDSVT